MLESVETLISLGNGVSAHATPKVDGFVPQTWSVNLGIVCQASGAEGGARGTGFEPQNAPKLTDLYCGLSVST